MHSSTVRLDKQLNHKVHRHNIQILSLRLISGEEAPDGLTEKWKFSLCETRKLNLQKSAANWTHFV